MLNKENINEKMLATAPKAALDIISQLNKSGYDAYLVGGCVRDTLEGGIPHDWDITTSATPEQMKEVVNYHSIDTGLQHGTITFMVDGEPYETTVFRTEGEYSDGRHPDSVAFVSTVEEDLARRDFTVNAMAWSPNRGLVDPFDGFEDLNKNKLRGVGNPVERFTEDGLRIMRAARFAATHGYQIEENTARAMHDTLDMLDNISAERITSEFVKMLGAKDGQHVKDIFVEFKDVMFKAVPELKTLESLDSQDNTNHDRTLFEHSVDTMALMPADGLMRFIALVHDIGKPAAYEMGVDGQAHYYGHMDDGRKIVEAMCERMKMSNEEKERMTFLVGNHDYRPRETNKSARRFLVKMGSDKMLKDILTLMEADISTHSPESVARVMPRFKAACECIKEEQSKALAMKVSDMAVNGNTLMELGYKPGPEMGAALNEMFALVVDGELDNDADVLSKYAVDVLDEINSGERLLAKDKKTFVRPDGSDCSPLISNVNTDTPDELFKSKAYRVAKVGHTENSSELKAKDNISNAAGATPVDNNTSAKKKVSGKTRASGKSYGDGRVYVSPHVRKGVKVSGYYRNSSGKK